MASEIQLVIFDMDDLMIHSHPAHMEVFEAVMQKHGASLKNPQNPLTTLEEASQFGKRIKDILAFFKQKYEINSDVDELDSEFNERLLPVFADNFVPMPGLIPLVNSLREKGYTLAVASSSIRPKIDIVLNKLDLIEPFRIIVSGEEIKHGKPAPDIFLRASERAGIEPVRSLVLEDATNGVLAAKSAGMHVIGVHNRFTYERLGLKQDLSKADLEVESLEEITPSTIKSFNTK